MFRHEKVMVALGKNCIVVQKQYNIKILRFSRQDLNHRIGAHTYTNQTVPYGTALLGWGSSRHFVPGYDRTVPPGHFATASH